MVTPPVTSSHVFAVARENFMKCNPCLSCKERREQSKDSQQSSSGGAQPPCGTGSNRATTIAPLLCHHSCYHSLHQWYPKAMCSLCCLSTRILSSHQMVTHLPGEMKASAVSWQVGSAGCNFWQGERGACCGHYHHTGCLCERGHPHPCTLGLPQEWPCF